MNENKVVAQFIARWQGRGVELRLVTSPSPHYANTTRYAFEMLESDKWVHISGPYWYFVEDAINAASERLWKLTGKF